MVRGKVDKVLRSWRLVGKVNDFWPLGFHWYDGQGWEILFLDTCNLQTTELMLHVIELTSGHSRI